MLSISTPPAIKPETSSCRAPCSFVSNASRTNRNRFVTRQDQNNRTCNGRKQVCLAEPQRQQSQPPPPDDLIIFSGGVLLFLLVVAGTRVGTDGLEELLYGDGLSGGFLGLGAGDMFAAVLWSISLYFVSPLQLLLLFLGKIETERPSDWFMNILGQAQGQPVKELGYQHPSYVRALTVLACIASGFTIAFVLENTLGDATWAVSSGIASCMAAGVYEIGRPQRLTSSEAIKLEAQWQVFARFAEDRLQQGGNCHESEIWRAFKAENPKFRLQENAIEEKYLRDMVANWYPLAKRTSSGYYKNVTLKPRTSNSSEALSEAASSQASN